MLGNGYQQGQKWTGTRRYGVPADAISMPADSAAAIVEFTISIPRESCTNAKAKYSSSVVPPDPSVHFYHWVSVLICIQISVITINPELVASRNSNPKPYP